MTNGYAGSDKSVLLDVKGLKKYFPIRRGLLQKTVGLVKAVDDVTFLVNRGETLSLVGESGCGKTTTARCILRAIVPTAGQVLLSDNGALVDVATVPKNRLRSLRRQMQMIFQDPFSSLNPRMTLLDIVGEPLFVHGVGNLQERTDRVVEILRLVGLRPEYMRRYPHAFSGGQRQRIGIARALALHPRLIVADEPVSALDVSVQAQILNLLLELQERLGLTYLFVAHDLSVVALSTAYNQDLSGDLRVIFPNVKNKRLADWQAFELFGCGVCNRTPTANVQISPSNARHFHAYFHRSVPCNYRALILRGLP